MCISLPSYLLIISLVLGCIWYLLLLGLSLELLGRVSGQVGLSGRNETSLEWGTCQPLFTVLTMGRLRAGPAELLAKGTGPLHWPRTVFSKEGSIFNPITSAGHGTSIYH
jgi:hypothetical protein